MIDSLITSKTRIKLLVKFFLNPATTAYLRSLAAEFGESTNAIRLELNRMESSRLLEGETRGNRKIFKANQKHPLFSEISSIVHKYFGFDVILEAVVNKLGDLERVYVTGELAKGIDTKEIDLLFVGNIDEAYLSQLVQKVEDMIQRKISTVICPAAIEQEFLVGKKYMLIYGN